jgi:formylglycine-generating enzyme required for sulfatase activity
MRTSGQPTARRPRPLARALLLAAALALAACAPSDAGPAGYELPYGPSPFAPSEARVEGGGLLPLGALGDSAACGPCHSEIYAQWASSLHRAAAEDRFYRFAVDRMADDYGVAATRLCEGCHDPGRLLSGGVDRAAPADPSARLEGVSCLACHLVTATHPAEQTGAIANASYTITLLPRDVLFPDAADGAALQRHGAALRRPFLSENRFCDSCHRFFVPTQMAGHPPGRLRLQSEEAMGTPFGDPEDPGYQSCVDCHMPLVPGKDPAAKGGLIHDHRSLGSNLWVPAVLGDTAHVAATREFRRAGAVRLEVQDFARDADGALQLPVVLHNERNGHDFPTGATDVSETWIEATLTDAAGRVVFRSPGLDAYRFLSPDAPSITTRVTLLSQDLDDLHDLFSQVERVHHPRVRPVGSLELRVPVPALPADVALPLRARVVLRARHGNERWNRWTFNWADVEVPVADLAEAERDLGPLPEAPAPAPAPTLRTPPAGMVYVPGGTYVVGVDPRTDPLAHFDEYPPHRVALPGFFLDRVPVTNGAYALAVAAGVVPPPAAPPDSPLAADAWRDGRPPAGRDDHPVVFATWEEADRYCQSRGQRLPTEFEWEAAARGTDGRRYAWGDTFDPALCNTAPSAWPHIEPVGSRPGNAGPFGTLDQGCNVPEWTASYYRSYPKLRHIDNRDMWWNAFNRWVRVVRGAGAELLPWRARASHRGFDEPTVRKTTGFRCAADAEGGTAARREGPP